MAYPIFKHSLTKGSDASVQHREQCTIRGAVKAVGKDLFMVSVSVVVVVRRQSYLEVDETLAV